MTPFDINKNLPAGDAVIGIVLLILQILTILINYDALRKSSGLWRLGFIITIFSTVILSVANMIRVFADVDVLKFDSFLFGLSIPLRLFGPSSVFALITIWKHHEREVIRKAKEERDE